MYYWDSYFTNIGLIDDGNMEHTCHLWEKYNVVEGNANAASEYGTPAMLGWTWGVYRHFLKLLGRE